MYGHKQIISCFLIVGLLTILNFYKSIIKRDREYQQQRDERRKLAADEELRQTELKLLDLTRHLSFIGKMLEYEDRCCDLHALIFKPKLYDKFFESRYVQLDQPSNLLSEIKSNDIVLQDDDPKKEHTTSKLVMQKAPDFRPSSTSTPPTANTKSNGLICLCVIILLGLLVKAALDLSKQFNENNENTNMADLRRCSLQSYSIMKYNQTQKDKGTANNNIVRSTAAAAAKQLVKKTATITAQLSLDSGSTQLLQQQDSLMRHMNLANSQNYKNGSGIITTVGEPSTPASNTNKSPGKMLLAGRPAPLLRRCSVPTLAHNQNILGNCSVTNLRRPSMDSFSEDDNSALNLTSNIPIADVKRRVRMIHRH